MIMCDPTDVDTFVNTTGAKNYENAVNMDFLWDNKRSDGAFFLRFAEL
jgi:hypothetical protein